MILESAYALADYIKDHCSDDYIYPPIKDLRKISVYVATRVLSKALEDGSTTVNDLKNIDIQSYVEENFSVADGLVLLVSSAISSLVFGIKSSLLRSF